MFNSSASYFLHPLTPFGDCKDEDGISGRCVAGAINNYTSQLLTYGTDSQSLHGRYSSAPLHVGFTTDGRKYNQCPLVHKESVLHHVWDDSIIETAEERFYNSNVDSLIDAIQTNITKEWANEIQIWENCSNNKPTCPDIYASEGIKAACGWAYKGVSEGSVVEEDYFLSRLPMFNRRLAQGGVRLAATLNRIFG